MGPSAESFLIQQRPQRKEDDAPRTIDLFYEQAYQSDTSKMPFYIMMLALGIANSGDATELGCMNYLLANDDFKNDILKGDVQVGGATLAGSVFGGMIIGGIMTGVLGDRLGRRPLLLSGLGLNSISGILACVSPNIYIFYILRFLCGLGIGAVISSILTLTTESSPPTKRGFFGALVVGFWTIGSIYMAVVAKIMFGMLNMSWRLFLCAAVLPIVLGFVIVFLMVPESARYLALADRHSEAAKAANRIANYLGFYGSKLEVEEIHHFYPPDVETVRLVKEKSLREHTDDLLWTLSQIYSKKFLARSLTLQFIMICIAFGNGLMVWINTIYVEIGIEDVYSHLIYFALANLPGNIATALLLDVLGRKKLLVIGLVLASFFLFMGSFFASATDPNLIMFSFCTCCYSATTVMIYTSVFVLGSEIYPTSLRGTGMGMATASARMSAMLVQFIYGAFSKRPDIIFIIGGVSLLVGAAAVTCLGVQDMTNKPLSDSHVDSENGTNNDVLKSEIL